LIETNDQTKLTVNIPKLANAKFEYVDTDQIPPISGPSKMNDSTFLNKLKAQEGVVSIFFFFFKKTKRNE